ncbi:hypothetical protein ScPMuIL_015201 [Solemya velum]
MWISTTLIAILLHANVANGNSCPVEPILEKLTSLDSLLVGIEERLARMESSSQCSRVATCVAPPVVANMRSDKRYEVEYPGTTTYKCDKGYISNGEPGVIKCQKNGEWSRLFLVCTGVSCGVPPEVYGMKHDVTEPVSFPGTVTYSCEPGFHENENNLLSPSGQGISRCLENATWTHVEKECIVDECGDPPKFPGMVLLGSYHRNVRFTENLYYQCDGGFPSSGEYGVLTCQEGGIFSDMNLICTN